MRRFKHIFFKISLILNFSNSYANLLELELPNHHRFHCEIAKTPEQLQQGLMHRTTLAASSGMLFIFPYSHPWTFWMKNTQLSLDILWLNSNKQVIYMIENAQPCENDCQVYQPGPDAKAAYVLELAGGQAHAENLKPGSQLKFLGTAN